MALRTALLWPPLLVALCGLGACGGATPDRSQQPTARPDQAAQAYVVAADQEAAASAAAQALCPGPHPSPTEIHRCAAAFAAADRTFVAALRRIAFPAGAATDVARLVAAKSREADDDDALIRSADPDGDHDVDTDLDAALANDDIASRRVDADLGIPITGDNPPRADAD